MRDLAYYGGNPFTYPNKGQYKRDYIASIDQMKLTAQERNDLLGSVNKVVNDWFSRMVKPYNDEAAKRKAEFWADCREEFGYDQIYNEKGCQALEHYAWQEGSGFYDVYSKLQDLTELANELAKNVK